MMEVSTQKKSMEEIESRLVQKEAELAIINSVGEAMSKQLDVATVTKIVGDKVREILDTEVTEILLLNSDTNKITIPYSYYNGYQKIEDFELGEGLTSLVINSGEPLVLGTLEEQNKVGAIFDENLGEADDTESYLGVPIKFNNEVIGVISIQSYKKNVYNKSNVQFLSMLSNNIGVALYNAQLHEKSQQILAETELRNTELSVINSVQEGLVAKMEIQSIYDLVGEKIRGIFDAQVVSIGIYDYENNLCQFKYDIEKGERFYDEPRRFISIDKHLIKTKKILLLNKNLIEGLEKIGEKNPKAAEGTEMPKSAIWVPLMAAGVVIGYVSLQNVDRENAFEESDIRLLTTLANSMSVALENARLFDQTKKLLAESEQRNTELGVINSVQEGLVKQMDLQAIYDLVGQQIREIFDTQVVVIASFDHENKTEIFNYVIEKGERYYPESRKYDKVREYLIKHKNLIHINENYEKAAKKYGMKVVAGTEMPKSLLFVPLTVGDTVRGYITLQNIDKENAFSESDVRLLTTLTNSMSVALENARLFDETTKLLDETKQQTIELGIINSVGDGLAKQLDFQAIIDLVGDKIREVFNAQVVTISTYNKNENEIHHRHFVELDQRYYFDKPQPVDIDRKEIIETRKPLKFNTAQEAINHSGEEVLAGEMPESFMGVPILMGGEVTGVITVQDIEKQNLYSDKDVRLLMTLASNMGVALENARLFEETKRLLNETQQRNVELSILNAIQEGLVMEMDFESIINLVGDKFREALGFQDLGIRLYDKETNTLHFPYEYEHGERLYIESMEPTPFSNYVLSNGKLLYLKQNNDEEAAKLGIKGQLTIPGTDRSKSMVSVPIMLGNEAKGLILIEDYENEDAFSESDIRLLTTVSNSMSVALENARLFNETNRLLDESQQRNTELSILNTIQEGMVKEMDFNGVIKLVGDKLQEVLNYRDIGIRIYDKETDLVHFPYEYEHGEKLEIEPMKPGGISRHILNTKKMLLLKKNDEETLKKLGIEGVVVIPGTDRSKSMIAVPLVSGNEARGLFIIEDYEKEDAFDETDVRLLTTLANSMSVALENARLFNETLRLLDESKKRTDELSTVNSISQAIVGHLEINKLIKMVGDKVRDLFNASIVYVALLDKEKEMIEFPYGHGDEYPPLKYGEGLTSHIIMKNEPLLMNKEVDEKTNELGVARIGTPSSSYLGVPIPVGDEIIGVVSVQSTEKESLFNEDDMRLLNTIAAHVGIAINNANSYKELNETLENLKSTQDQLVAQEKLASLGQLTAGIAHEIKNPLNFVNNFSELSVGLVEELGEEIESLQSKNDEESFRDIKEILGILQQNAKKINEHGKRADSIVHSMLQHSRGKTGDRQATDINSMLDEDLNLVYHGLRAQDSTFNIKIERDYNKQLEHIKVVPQDISRVFLNILTNGCYEAHRKKVETKSEETARIKVSTHDAGRFIEVRIKDNGNGIPKHIHNDLFKPFFTTKPSGKGTGLGLSISYDIIVHEHNGEIKFDTKEGEYTEFIVKLPKG
jgi:GAF domain-containing protein